MTRIAIQCLPSSARDARRLAARLGISLHEIELHRFPDGELRVTVGAPASTTIIYASLDQPNEKLIALSFAAEALRRGGAERIVLLAPYLCYMRQDAAFQQGEAISQKVVGKLLAAIVDRVITVDAHLHRTERIETVFPGIKADDLSAMPAIAETLRSSGIDPDTVIVGPDAESKPWVADLAGRLNLAHCVAQKVRRGDRSVKIELGPAKQIRGRPVLLVDDMVSSGGTLKACAEALVAAGAVSIDVVITHALFPPDLTGEIVGAGIRSIRSTNSVPHPTNAIVLDDVFLAALRDEADNAPAPETAQ
ncbi:MAG: ribose-phosphate diphosphokinase [Xanthobacteraceae bacterium]|nr:MAG: ribose-phosphate diphosphokinase [Xanthobacteraceae bacterium]